MKVWIKRACISFAISSFAGLAINLLIDIAVNVFGSVPDFCSISPDFVRLFPTPVMAAYANIILYGVIGASFAVMTFVFEIDRLGFLIQYLIYFCATSVVLIFITMYLWKLQRVPAALICTLIGYGLSFVIMGVMMYRETRADIDSINEIIAHK